MNAMSDNLVRVNIRAVYMHPKHKVPTLFLADEDDMFIISMVIGFLEAQSIIIGWQRLPSPRPTTADLVRSIIEDDFTARIDKVVITDVLEGAFMAKLIIHRGEQIIERDCRPSDALALAVRSDSPIYATEQVIEKIESEQENIRALIKYLEAEAKDADMNNMMQS